MKNSLKYAVILFLVSGLCAMLITALYSVVNPIIADRTAQKVEDNLAKIYADDSFEYIDVSAEYDLSTEDTIDALYQVTLADGTQNYVYELSPEGRNAEIIYLLAYDELGTVLKIQYVQMRETKGRGDRITEEPFLNGVYSQNASEMDVETISGATYSSTAMKESIEATAEHLVSEVLK